MKKIILAVATLALLTSAAQAQKFKGKITETPEYHFSFLLADNGKACISAKELIPDPKISDKDAALKLRSYAVTDSMQFSDPFYKNLAIYDDTTGVTTTFNKEGLPIHFFLYKSDCLIFKH